MPAVEDTLVLTVQMWVSEWVEVPRLEFVGVQLPVAAEAKSVYLISA